MRPTISGLVAAIAVMIVTAAPAMACGGLFPGYGPCAQGYVPTPVYSGCYSGCSWRERLPDPVQQYGYPVPHHVQQYYYVNQGPTYTGPGNLAPYPVYREGSVSGLDAYRHRRHHASYHGRRYGHREHVLRRYD
jgi:hypothetical protein